MARIWFLGAAVILAALAAACEAGGSDETAGTPTSTVLAPTPQTHPERPEITISADKQYFATVDTTKGSFRIKLRPDLAIQTVNSFVFLARQGYYDGVTFHRVIPDFVAQGGDPTGTGSGGPGYTLPAEFSDAPFKRGTVGLARSGDPDSGGSQFFIAYRDQPSLDGQYTVFGEVVEGMEVVDSLTPRDPENIATPQPAGDQIISIAIEER